MKKRTLFAKKRTAQIVSQYKRNHKSLNMEFIEFVADKLKVSETSAARIIKEYKREELQINNNLIPA